LIWKKVLKLIRLDIYNASTFACHDLLSCSQEGLSIKSWIKDRTILYSKVHNLAQIDVIKLRNEFQDRKDKLKNNMLMRRKKELKKTFIRDTHTEIETS
jgi:hypothetical protein